MAIMEADITLTMSVPRQEHARGGMARRLRANAAAAVAAILFVCSLRVGEARTFNYDTFCSWPYLTENGLGQHAVVKQGTDLLLTQAPQQATAATLFYQRPVAVVAGFQTQFAFRVADKVGEGPEGFAFVIQNQSPAALGDSGPHIGYTGILNSLAIEFDFHQDASMSDPNDNHVSFHSRGNLGNSAVEYAPVGIVSSSCSGGTESQFWLTTSNLPTFPDGEQHSVRVGYDGITKMLSVTVDNNLSPQLQCRVDLQESLDLYDSNMSYVGFSASTGFGSGDVVLHNWWLQDLSDDAPASQCFGGFFGNLCDPPDHAGLGNDCSVASSDCASCLSYSRSCCGWCTDTQTCQQYTKSSDASVVPTCSDPVLACPATPPDNGLDTGDIVGIILSTLCVATLCVFGVVWYRRRRLSGPGAALPTEATPFNATGSRVRDYAQL